LLGSQLQNFRHHRLASLAFYLAGDRVPQIFCRAPEVKTQRSGKEIEATSGGLTQSELLRRVTWTNAESGLVPFHQFAQNLDPVHFEFSLRDRVGRVNGGKFHLGIAFSVARESQIRLVHNAIVNPPKKKFVF
jgi:hypothetical protein